MYYTDTTIVFLDTCSPECSPAQPTTYCSSALLRANSAITLTLYTTLRSTALSHLAHTSLRSGRDFAFEEAPARASSSA